jgi:hypothetical protein
MGGVSELATHVQGHPRPRCHTPWPPTGRWSIGGHGRGCRANGTHHSDDQLDS